MHFENIWLEGIHPKESGHGRAGQYAKSGHKLPAKIKALQAVNHDQMTNGVPVTETEITLRCLCRNKMLDAGKKYTRNTV